uniref:Uncharacterized protein n=1 Tax=Arundo donax TaxID=35708 RepID=A0A0A9J0W1_ARUDO
MHDFEGKVVSFTQIISNHCCI